MKVTEDFCARCAEKGVLRKRSIGALLYFVKSIYQQPISILKKSSF
jgi:hypothetical protein